LHVMARLALHPCEGRRALRPSSRPTAETRGSTDGRQTNRSGAEEAHAQIVVEDPCDPDAAAAMAGEGGVLVRIPVDADGLCTDALPSGGAALIHVTPEHQRPLGA